MKSTMLRALVTATVLLAATLGSLAQTTAFSYQGRLQDGGNPVTGLHDFEFRLFNAASGGAQQGPTVTFDDFGVTNGLFTATLDFGANFPGADRFLQIAVRPGASTGAYANLSPRQLITAAPYAVKALEAAGLPAGAVNGAMLADGVVTAGKLAPGAVSQLGASDGSPVNAVQVNANGLVGIGTNAPQAGLHLSAGRPFINMEVVQTLRDENGGLTNLFGASAVAVDGNLMAVVAIYDYGLTLFDVTNPSQPVPTAQVRNGDSGFPGIGQVHRAALQSNLLAVASYDGVVSLLNVSNRYAPVMLAQFRDGQGGWNELSGINSLAFSGNLLAIAARNDSAVTLVDVSNPANPIKRAELKDGFFGFTNLWGATAVAFKGNTLFIGSDNDQAVTVVDVSTPANPVKLAEFHGGGGGFQPLGYITAMAVAGNTLAVGSESQLTLVNAANPAAPFLAAQLDGTTQPAITDSVLGLASSGNLLAVAYYFGSKAVVLDVSQPAVPFIHAMTTRVGGEINAQNLAAHVAFAGTNLMYTLRDVGAVSVVRMTPRSVGLVSEGWVGIGITQPLAPLHVVGDMLVENARKMTVGAVSVSLGVGARVESVAGGTALGQNSLVSGENGTALGYGARAIGNYSVASGYGSEANGLHATAIGTAAWASGNYSVSLGNNTIAGGRSATALGELSAALGDRSLAAGYLARADHAGSFVWADDQGTYFSSTSTNQFNVRATGGARFETGGAGLTVDGLAVPMGPIVSTQLADGAVTGTKLAAGAVSVANLGVGAVTSEKIADGSVTVADVDASGFGTTFWRAGGNAGTTAGNHFIGTTDNQPVEFRVNNVRVLRLEPASGTPNLLGGYSGNIISNGVVGAVIGGGGGPFLFGTYPHRVGGDFASVLGGLGNVASGSVSTAFGNQTKALAANSTAFGSGTVSSGLYAVAMGAATVAGGRSSTAMGEATVASGDYSTAMGSNARAHHQGSFVWSDNRPAFFDSTTSNQFSIRASGGVRLNNDTSLNFGNQTRQMLNLYNADYGIGVQGGAGYFRSGGDFFWYLGGSHSDANGNAGSGGIPLMSLKSSGNLGLGTTTPTYPLEVQNGFAVGRFTTTNNGNGAVLILKNTGTPNTYLGAINFDDVTGTPGQIGYLASGQMSFRVAEGERMNLQAGGLYVDGAIVLTSDRNAKAEFVAVDAQEVLEKVAALPLQSWSYTNRPGVKHVGPMAQDFRAAFGLGEDDKHIATVDADGVALAAIQGLNQKVEEQGAALKSKDTRIAELEKRLSAIESLLQR